MSRFLASLRATWSAGFIFVYLFLVGTPAVVHAWLTGRIGFLYGVARWGSRAGLWLGGIRWEVRGLENIPNHVCMYMANHQSNIDPPLLFVVVPPRIAIMAKKQLFSLPVLGQALRLGEFIPVHREVHEEARASVDEALSRLEHGLSLLVFPEGTRSYDGRLLRFKHGVFLLAIRAGVPIVPITVDGATAAMAKGRWEIYPGNVRVTIHPPVPTQGRTEEERGVLAEEVKRIVESALPAELHAPREASPVRS